MAGVIVDSGRKTSGIGRRRTAGAVTWAFIAGSLALILVAAAVWLLTARTIVVEVDGQREIIRTHRATVEDLLLDLGLRPQANDRISLGLTASLTNGARVSVARARPVRILADGRDLTVFSWGATPRALLADAGLTVETYDEILVEGRPIAADAELPALAVETAKQAAVTYDRGFAWDIGTRTPLQVRIYRAVPITVHEGGLPYVVDTTAQTVGEALRQAEVILYLGDRVHPSLGQRITANMHVFIQRSIPVSVLVDGRQLKTRTKAKTVGDTLSDLGIVVAGQDRVEPSLDTELYDNVKIRITRIAEDIEVEEEIAPFETIFVADPNLPIDTQEVLASGANGITRTRYRVRYENGDEVARTREDRWVAQEPAERRIAYGQGIQPQTATMPDGSVITYWRKVKMLATSYSAASAGGNRTRTGDVVRQGVVAVDPRIIPLRSQVYVPGYGIGDALDTGGGIRSRRIDLAYDDANFQSVRRWVDVYLLWPPPADGDITWVLPNYPPVPE
jgi:uncharacterized protein YabE (DUF348 family)